MKEQELLKLKGQEDSLWFAMLCVFDLIQANEKAEDPEDVRKEYEEFLKKHLDNLEEIRSSIARKEYRLQNEIRNKNK